ncbi:hypothetical protein KEM54_004727, partial [Ascosphaera aggregata]
TNTADSGPVHPPTERNDAAKGTDAQLTEDRGLHERHGAGDGKQRMSAAESVNEPPRATSVWNISTQQLAGPSADEADFPPLANEAKSGSKESSPTAARKPSLWPADDPHTAKQPATQSSATAALPQLSSAISSGPKKYTLPSQADIVSRSRTGQSSTQGTSIGHEHTEHSQRASDTPEQTASSPSWADVLVKKKSFTSSGVGREPLQQQQPSKSWADTLRTSEAPRSAARDEAKDTQLPKRWLDNTQHEEVTRHRAAMQYTAEASEPSKAELWEALQVGSSKSWADIMDEEDDLLNSGTTPQAVEKTTRTEEVAPEQPQHRPLTRSSSRIAEHYPHETSESGQETTGNPPTTMRPDQTPRLSVPTTRADVVQRTGDDHLATQGDHTRTEPKTEPFSMSTGQVAHIQVSSSCTGETENDAHQFVSGLKESESIEDTEHITHHQQSYSSEDNLGGKDDLRPLEQDHPISEPVQTTQHTVCRQTLPGSAEKREDEDKSHVPEHTLPENEPIAAGPSTSAQCESRHQKSSDWADITEDDLHDRERTSSDKQPKAVHHAAPTVHVAQHQRPASWVNVLGEREKSDVPSMPSSSEDETKALGHYPEQAVSTSSPLCTPNQPPVPLVGNPQHPPDRLDASGHHESRTRVETMPAAGSGPWQMGSSGGDVLPPKGPAARLIAEARDDSSRASSSDRTGVTGVTTPITPPATMTSATPQDSKSPILHEPKARSGLSSELCFDTSAGSEVSPLPGTYQGLQQLQYNEAPLTVAPYNMPAYCEPTMYQALGSFHPPSLLTPGAMQQQPDYSSNFPYGLPATAFSEPHAHWQAQGSWGQESDSAGYPSESMEQSLKTTADALQEQYWARVSRHPLELTGPTHERSRRSEGFGQYAAAQAFPGSDIGLAQPSHFEGNVISEVSRDPVHGNLVTGTERLPPRGTSSQSVTSTNVPTGQTQHTLASKSRYRGSAREFTPASRTFYEFPGTHTTEQNPLHGQGMLYHESKGLKGEAPKMSSSGVSPVTRRGLRPHRGRVEEANIQARNEPHWKRTTQEKKKPQEQKKAEVRKVVEKEAQANRKTQEEREARRKKAAQEKEVHDRRRVEEEEEEARRQKAAQEKEAQDKRKAEEEKEAEERRKAQEERKLIERRAQEEKEAQHRRKAQEAQQRRVQQEKEAEDRRKAHEEEMARNKKIAQEKKQAQQKMEAQEKGASEKGQDRLEAIGRASVSTIRGDSQAVEKRDAVMEDPWIEDLLEGYSSVNKQYGGLGKKKHNKKLGLKLEQNCQMTTGARSEDHRITAVKPAENEQEIHQPPTFTVSAQREISPMRSSTSSSVSERFQTPPDYPEEQPSAIQPTGRPAARRLGLTTILEDEAHTEDLLRATGDATSVMSDPTPLDPRLEERPREKDEKRARISSTIKAFVQVQSLLAPELFKSRRSVEDRVKAPLQPGISERKPDRRLAPLSDKLCAPSSLSPMRHGPGFSPEGAERQQATGDDISRHDLAKGNTTQHTEVERWLGLPPTEDCHDSSSSGDTASFCTASSQPAAASPDNQSHCGEQDPGHIANPAPQAPQAPQAPLPLPTIAADASQRAETGLFMRYRFADDGKPYIHFTMPAPVAASGAQQPLPYPVVPPPSAEKLSNQECEESARSVAQASRIYSNFHQLQPDIRHSASSQDRFPQTLTRQHEGLRQSHDLHHQSTHNPEYHIQQRPVGRGNPPLEPHRYHTTNPTAYHARRRRP